MAVSRMIPLAPGVQLTDVVNSAAANLQAQGFAVTAIPLGPTSVSLTAAKDRDGFKNFLGLGLESRATLILTQNGLSVSVEDEWTNKIIALAIGWILCMIPFITGIVGAINQAGLAEKIFTAIMAAGNGGYAPNPGAQQSYAQQSYAPQSAPDAAPQEAPDGDPQA